MKIQEVLRIDHSKVKNIPVDQFQRPFYGDNYQNTWKGPHSGKEITLLINKIKPAAILQPNFLKNPELFELIKNGELKIFPFIHPNLPPNHKMVFVTQQGEEWRGNQLLKIYKSVYDQGEDRSISKKDHIKIGLLLGYSKEDIKKFIDSLNL